MTDVIARCTFCKEPVDPYSTTTFQRTRGWAQARRIGGGTNAVVCEERLEEWACYSCIQKQKRGVSTDQASLL